MRSKKHSAPDCSRKGKGNWWKKQEKICGRGLILTLMTLSLKTTSAKNADKIAQNDLIRIGFSVFLCKIIDNNESLA
jgi:hypothetical protein